MPSYEFRYHLSERCPVDLTARRVRHDDTTYEVSLSKGAQDLVIRPVDAPDPRTAAALGRDVGNLFLTRIFSRIQYGPALPYDHSWTDLATGKGGTVVGIPPLSWFTGDTRIGRNVAVSQNLIGAAFMRAGDVACGCFDAYRNFYLALESIGKRVRTGHGRDASVISDTIGSVVSKSKIKALQRKLPGVVLPPGKTLTGKAVADLETVLYGVFRCALNHSGKTTDFTPFNSQDEQQVGSALSLMRATAWQYVRYERVHLR